MKAEFSKTFPHTEGDDFSAYNTARTWCEDHGYSCGSMQRGATTMVYRCDCLVAKHRNLGRADLDEAAGQIVGRGGRFRGGPVTVTFWGEDALHMVETEIRGNVQMTAPEDKP